jgi:hypothetical protein
VWPKSNPIQPWARNLPYDRDLRERLYGGLSLLYQRLLAPYWPRLTDVYNADRAVRLRHFLAGGVDNLLAQANPGWIRWNPPVLEIRMVNGIDSDAYPGGEGILLVPSVFAIRSVVDTAAKPQPIVTYPACHDQPLGNLTTFIPQNTTPGTTTALTALLGTTRAAVLTTIAERPGCGTTQLAKALNIANASASQHATVLRAAGLIHTVRYRNTALHSPTTLGNALLNTTPERAAPDS